MSDTPRTDAAIVCGEHIAVSLEFARQLERELAAAKAENESLRRAYVRPDDLREQISTLHAVCRENIISARIIASENSRGEQRSAIARDCHFIIMRTEAVLPPR